MRKILTKKTVKEIIRLLEDANDTYYGEWGNKDDDVSTMIEYLKGNERYWEL